MSFLLPTLLLATLPPNAVGNVPGLPLHPHDFRPPTREQVAMRMMIRQLLLERYDSNGDSELDKEERRCLMADAEAARKQQALTFIRRFDTDGDGQLSPEERAAMRQAMEERRHTGQEAAASAPPPAHHHAHKRGHRGRHHGPKPPRPHMGKTGRTVAFLVQQLTMDAYDEDRDAHLDRKESAHLRADGEKLYKAREAELLARFDADKDGKLCETELRTALAELFPHFPPPPGDRPPHPHPEHGVQPPPPPHGGQGVMPPPPHHRRGSLHRLLDTHFDIDILINLAHPQAEMAPQPPAPIPCSPSTPSAS